MTRYISLAEFFWLAEQITGLDTTTLTASARLELTESALHAPAAEFGGVEFYPDIIDKAAVLTCRIAWNHPLPDGNKRAAWASLVLFLDLNDFEWDHGQPNVDEAEYAMVEVAAHSVNEEWLAAWLRERISETTA